MKDASKGSGSEKTESVPETSFGDPRMRPSQSEPSPGCEAPQARARSPARMGGKEIADLSRPQASTEPAATRAQELKVVAGVRSENTQKREEPEPVTREAIGSITSSVEPVA